MTILIALLLMTSGVRTVSGNFAADLYGPVDTRPGTWGHADSFTLPIQFHAPEGYRVRVLSIEGDLIAWIKSLPGEKPTPAESVAGVLAGFQTGSSGQSPDCDYCSSGCPVYVQDSVTWTQPKTRVPFERTGLMLDADNVLVGKVAEYLNTTGKPIHLELTYTMQYRFEKGEK